MGRREGGSEEEWEGGGGSEGVGGSEEVWGGVERSGKEGEEGVRKWGGGGRRE